MRRFASLQKAAELWLKAMGADVSARVLGVDNKVVLFITGDVPEQLLEELKTRTFMKGVEIRVRRIK